MSNENVTPKKSGDVYAGDSYAFEKWSPDFLNALRIMPNVTAAARSAGISRKTAYIHRKEKPDFAQAWDEALQEGVETLEREAQRRAFEGTQRPVFYKGKTTGFVREYSDTLAIFLLKAHAPEKYRDNIDITSKGEKINIAFVDVNTDDL